MIDVGELALSLMGIAASAGIVLGGWALKSTVNLRERMAALEESRFSSLDGERMRADLREEIHNGFDRVMRCIRKVQLGEECDEP